MAKILIDAYVNNNLGDDLLIKILCERYSNHDFYIFANKECRKGFSNITNIQFLEPILPKKSQYFFRIVNKLMSLLNVPKIQIIKFYRKNDFDVYVYYGGSVFMQVTKNSWKNKIRDYKYITTKIKNKIIMGSNFGPYSCDNFKFKNEELFKNYNFISMRDLYSYNLFPNLKNLYYGCDIAFNLNQNSNIDKNYYVISVIDLSFRKELKNYQEIYVTKIGIIVNKLIKYKKVVLMSFAENEGDLKMIKHIIKKFNFGNNVSIYNHKEINSSLKIIYESSGIIATRFHAVVLGLIYNKPTVPIIYSEKTEHQLKDLNYKGYKIRISDLNLINTDMILKSLNTKPEFDRSIIPSSKNHFRYLDNLLKEGYYG